VGYSPAEEREERKIGLIPVDATFSPIARVNYKVEETRVGRVTNYDKLILEVWTDGTLEPKKAILDASEILVSYFKQIISPKEIKKEKKEEVDTLGPVGKLSVEEIGLPTRVANALIKAGYETVEDLVSAKKEDLNKVRNLGEKSLKIVSAALAEKGVNFSFKE
jgi:DNA-directed RNA polymerase subunit alpha